MKSRPQFTLFEQRMRAEGLPEIFIETFRHYYDQLVQGKTGLISESEIEPVDSLPDIETLPEKYTAVGSQKLGETAVIKLNGGLGTSMGLEKAKSLLPVRDGHSFLDIIANQATLANMPLILMNSFSTEADSMAVLGNYPAVGKHLPATFLQHKELKVRISDFSPAEWPANPQLEWCPPGHGDIYTALVTSGILDELLANGYKYAFVSNADNLGAVIDAKILGYFAEEGFDFMMEVADRTSMDKKGGHLAQQGAGKFTLRESAQCRPQDKGTFEDITRHKYFNTNSLWLNLPALKRTMQARNNMLGLPMMRNEKHVDPRDAGSTAVYQIETAMGSAIAVFENAQALRVPRTRFAPVKKTNDLLAVRSDLYLLTDDFRVIPNPQRELPSILIELDSNYYKFVTDLDDHFPHGAPSLINCSSLIIEGDVHFGRNVVCTGDVVLKNETGSPLLIPDGAILGG